MYSRKPFYLLVLMLIVAAIASIAYRGFEDKGPLIPGEKQMSWSVDASIAFTANLQATEVSFSLPADPAFEILVENAISPGYGLNMNNSEHGRRAIWTMRSPDGPQKLYYRVTLIPTGITDLVASKEPEAANPYSWPATEKVAAEVVINKAWGESASNLSYAQQLNKLLNRSDKSQRIALLLDKNTKQQLFLRLLHSKGVPARMVSGLLLEDQRRNQALTPYIEVYDEGFWHLFNPHDGSEGRPENLLLWERAGESVLDVIGGKQSQVSFSILQDTRSALATAKDVLGKKGGLGFSLYQLPLEEQGLFKGILLIPIGVLMVVFLRVIIGLKTSGTFMPVLIALAFIQTSLLTGLIGFTLVVACGLMIRSYLSHLNLLLISRISAVIIVVIGIIGVFTLLSYKLGLNEGLTITFFPMIILAWTIERMSILWEEEGPKEVVLQGGGSLFVATLAYLAMSASWIQHWVFNFLGIHLLILAAVLLMGQYTGYRLLELRRFRPLAKVRADDF